MVLTHVPFKAVSDCWLVDDGSHHILVAPTGSTAAVIDVTLDLAALISTTTAAVNFFKH